MLETHRIFHSFCEKCDSNRSLFKEYLYEAVEYLKQSSNQDSINSFTRVITSIKLATGEIILDEFKYILEFNVDLPYDIDVLQNVCSYQKTDIFFYIINNYDVNLHNLVTNLKYSGSTNVEILKFFLEEGLLQHNINKISIDFYACPKKLKLCLDYGANLNYFIENTHTMRPMRLNVRITQEVLIFILDTIKTGQYSVNPESFTILLELIVSTHYYNLPNIFGYIRMLVDLGADPCRESIFLEACEHLDNAEIIRYFIEECGCDINMKNSEALYRSLINCYNRYNIFKLLLDMGIKVSDWAIDEAIQRGNEYINPLIDYGVPPDRIATITVDVHIRVFKNLVEKGVDYNKIIQESTSDVEPLV